MKRSHQHLSEVEVTAWILIAIFVAALLMFSYLFWKKVSRETAAQPEHFSEVVEYNHSESICCALPG